MEFALFYNAFISVLQNTQDIRWKIPQIANDECHNIFWNLWIRRQLRGRAKFSEIYCQNFPFRSKIFRDFRLNGSLFGNSTIFVSSGHFASLPNFPIWQFLKILAERKTTSVYEQDVLTEDEWTAHVYKHHFTVTLAYYTAKPSKLRTHLRYKRKCRHKKLMRYWRELLHKHKPSAYANTYVGVMFNEAMVNISIKCSLIGWKSFTYAFAYANHVATVAAKTLA